MLCPPEVSLGRPSVGAVVLVLVAPPGAAPVVVPGVPSTGPIDVSAGTRRRKCSRHARKGSQVTDFVGEFTMCPVFSR